MQDEQPNRTMKGRRILTTLLILSRIHLSLSVVWEYDTRHQYESLPASFGMRFEVGREYAARLQKIHKNPNLCEDKVSNATIIVPEDGTPVAILAKRGHCTYEEKARVAMGINPVVQYVIVYDDEVNGELKTMTAADASNITIGLQFVSSASGNDLLDQIDAQSSKSLEKGGVRILLDCYTPWLYPNGWVGWIMMLISCLGSFLLCISTGFIRRDGNVLVMGPHGSSYEQLLTDDDVDNLPEIEYNARSSEFDIAICSICLEEYTDGEKLKMLPCHHSFHANCIKPWLTERHSTCPLCKQRVSVSREEDADTSAVDSIEENSRGEVTIEDAMSVSANDGEIRRNASRHGWFFVQHPFNWQHGRRDSLVDQNDVTVPLLEENNV